MKNGNPFLTNKQMSINQTISEIETLIKEESKKVNKGEISYSYITGYLLGLVKGMAYSLNPRTILEEELEYLKRRSK